jgi:putative nucleotidyltransferase with HDIG domain
LYERGIKIQALPADHARVEVRTSVGRVRSFARERSLTLLWAFVLASAAILAVGAASLAFVLGRALERQALEDARISLTQYADGVLRRHLVRDGELAVDRDAPAVLADTLHDRGDILSTKVWLPDGTLAWTGVAPERIGQRFPVGHHLEEALEGEAEAELEELHGDESSVEAALDGDRVFEVYAPLRREDGTVVGAYEIYTKADRIEASLADGRRLVWLATGTVFLVLWLALVLLVRGASVRMRRQTIALRDRSRKLLESYRRLEESSLEAIESLNAAVEAKDPYTAGHSQRVQRIVVALGEELGLAPDRLAALSHAGLFHDIGKLAVPDAILTKPASLSDDEFARIKLHPEEGARIVGKLGRMRETVPLIRHHHERWDGTGYPDGLAGEEIPLEASITGLADAWDAMTTDRPYQRARTVADAAEEIRAGRGTQFAPVVVDAFFRVLRRTPDAFVAAPVDGDALLAAAG